MTFWLFAKLLPSISYLLSVSGPANQELNLTQLNIFQTEELSPELRTFLDRCLTVSVEERAGAAELLAQAFVKNKSGSVSSLIPNIKAVKERKK